MTRVEEIRQAWAKERKERIGTGDMVHFDSFLLGACYADEHPKNPWISVEDRLPDIGEKVITITNKGKLLLVARTTQPPHHEQGGWRWEHYVGKVTHWMPIPETQKGGEV